MGVEKRSYFCLSIILIHYSHFVFLSSKLDFYTFVLCVSIKLLFYMGSLHGFGPSPFAQRQLLIKQSLKVHLQNIMTLY